MHKIEHNVVSFFGHLVPEELHKDLFLTGRAPDAQYKRTRGAAEFDGGEDIASARQGYDRIIRENDSRPRKGGYRAGDYARGVLRGDFPKPQNSNWPTGPREVPGISMRTRKVIWTMHSSEICTGR
jgi:hypothetical protein